MNFLSKTLSTLTGGSSIPYNFGEKIVDSITSPNGFNQSSSSIWNIYNGTSKETPTLKVSIFEFELSNHANSKYARFAANSFQKWRSLKLLPGIVTLIDSFENENHLYLVTERIRPLVDLLDLGYPEDSISEDVLLLGFYQLTNCLKFINEDASTIHGNVCLDTIFVNESGEWKLGGFEVSTSQRDLSNYSNNFDQATQLSSFNQNIPPEFEKLGSGFCKNFDYGIKFDSYKFGKLLTLLFERSNRQIPNSMTAHLRKMINPSVTVRYTTHQFLTAGESSFFNIPLVQFYKQIGELSFKTLEEKMELFKFIENLTGNLPIGYFEFKLLPDLIKTFNLLKDNTETNQSILLFIILKNSSSDAIEEKTFQSYIKPLIFKAFTLPDRAIRMTLLTGLSDFINKLTNYEIQDKIFPQLITGFNDTNLTIRQETMKAILPLTSKISDRQLNNDLLRYLAKLQNDPEPEIRSNAIVCLTTISKDMSPSSRTAVLITAFGKSIKDTFKPLRLNTVIAFESSIDYFTPEICCSRVLSTLAPALLDKSSTVRARAEIVFELYLEKIRRESARLPTDDDDLHEFEDNNNGAVAANSNEAVVSSGLASLSLGSLGVTKNTIFGFGASHQNDSTASLTMKDTEAVVTPPVRQTTPVHPIHHQQQTHLHHQSTAVSSFGHDTSKGSSSLKLEDDFDFDDMDDDGWGFGDEDETPVTVMPPKPKKTITTNTSTTHPSSTKLGSLQTKKPAASKSGGALKLKPKNKLKLELEADATDEGWGDGW